MSGEQTGEAVARTEWRVLHSGGVDSYVRDCGTDEGNARRSAEVWGGLVQSRTVTETPWNDSGALLPASKCRTCRGTGWVPSGCECHDDPCPTCKPRQPITPPTGEPS